MHFLSLSTSQVGLIFCMLFCIGTETLGFIIETLYCTVLIIQHISEFI